MTRSTAVLAVALLPALPCCGSSQSTNAPVDTGSGGKATTETGGAPSSSGGANASGGGSNGNSAGSSGNGTSAGGSNAQSSTGGSSAQSSGGGSNAGGSTNVPANGPPPYDDVKRKIDAYKTAHPGNGGKDWDINAKTPAQLASDPAAMELLSLCGKDQRPVIPALAWEYGGSDHAWLKPDSSALVYCVYIPVNPGTDHWKYDAAMDHVTTDMYVLYPGENPCKSKPGTEQVLGCLGDPTNIEILVDTASLNDGADAGLDVSTASTELRLTQPDGTRIHLADNA